MDIPDSKLSRSWWRRMSRKQRAVLVLEILAALVAMRIAQSGTAGLFRQFILEPYWIPASSMVPTLQINDRIWASKLAYRLRDPQRGDIIVFRAPPKADRDQKAFIKRVVGLPGDRLAVHDGRLWRNGQPLDEPYTQEPMTYRFPEGGGEFVVPEDAVFVLGDNRNLSNDSHKWGPLPRGNLRGKAFCLFWPPEHWRGL